MQASGSGRVALQAGPPHWARGRSIFLRPCPCHDVRRAASSIPLAGGDSERPAPGPAGPVAGMTRQQLWMAALKLPMYSVGFVPVLVGAAAAHMDCGVLPWGRMWSLVLGAICIIAWLNLSNDGFDAQTGVDATKPESVVNLTGSRAGVLAASVAFFAAGLALLGRGLGASHDPRAAPMLGAAIACGYVYQGPPFRLSYKGLGEPLCFVAFGPLATAAFYLALLTPGGAAAASGAAAVGLAAVPAHVWTLSVLVGVTTTVILFCSHFHQIAGDTAAGKQSPLVRLGTARGCQVLKAGTATPYVITLAACLAGALPLTLLAATALSLPAARALVAFAEANHLEAVRIAQLKKFATKWHMAFGAAAIAGLAASGLV